jgi:hypothetical protein
VFLGLLTGGPALAQDTHARAVIKFVKSDPTLTTVARFELSSCAGCVLVQDPEYARENNHETLIDLQVPVRRTLALVFNSPAGSVRRVIVETGDIEFTHIGDRLIVYLPPLSDDAVNAGEFHTHIVEPGMVLRFEHDDPARRAGAYAGAPLDFVQRRAADNLTFAQREVIRQLGLGRTVERLGLGRIMLMGFDTNFPHGHTDAPAHVHMHMRWPDRAGTQISHYYIDPQGRLTDNSVGVQLLNMPARRFSRGERFTTIGRLGDPVYSHTITAEGSLSIDVPDGRSCLVSPTGHGFHEGAEVSCDGAAPVAVSVTDDLAAGELKVRTGNVEELFRYDRDTGVLVSAQGPPPVSASSYPPET